MKPPSLAVVLSVHNEESSLAPALESIRNLADEIIVVNNHSTDDTVNIAKKYTKLVYVHKNIPNSLNTPKNYGFSKAKSDWILSLDADERVSPELGKEIRSVMLSDPPVNGFWICRQNIVFGEWIQHGIWYPDRQLRLFRRGKGQFPQQHNHEYLEVEGNTNDLSGHLLHENYQSVSQYLDKINHYYTDNEVEVLLKSGKKLEWFDAIRMPASDFILNFFARESYKDGLHGLALSLLQAFYAFVIFAKAWEKQGFWKYNSGNFARDVKHEVGQKAREFQWWYSAATIPWYLKPKQVLKKLLSFS